jgi:rhodanese-related sulfurtransferase
MFGADWLLDAALMLIERTHRVENVATEELQKMLAGQEESPLLFDVRTAREFDTSRIASAVRLDPDMGTDEFRDRFGALMAGRDAVFYCSVGQRSSELLERVEDACRQAGARRCRNLRGGIFRWYNEGRPVVDASGTTDNIDGFDAVWGAMVERRK